MYEYKIMKWQYNLKIKMNKEIYVKTTNIRINASGEPDSDRDYEEGVAIL